MCHLPFHPLKSGGRPATPFATPWVHVFGILDCLHPPTSCPCSNMVVGHLSCLSLATVRSVLGSSRRDGSPFCPLGVCWTVTASPCHSCPCPSPTPGVGVGVGPLSLSLVQAWTWCPWLHNVSVLMLLQICLGAGSFSVGCCMGHGVGWPLQLLHLHPWSWPPCPWVQVL